MWWNRTWGPCGSRRRIPPGPHTVFGRLGQRVAAWRDEVWTAEAGRGGVVGPGGGGGGLADEGGEKHAGPSFGEPANRRRGAVFPGAIRLAHAPRGCRGRPPLQQEFAGAAKLPVPPLTARVQEG